MWRLRVRMLQTVAPVASALVVVAAGSRASADAPAFRVRYIAAEGCPSADVFSHEILARTSLAHAATGAERAVRFQVRLSTADDKSRGELAIQEIDGSVSARSVDGQSCGEVVSALALIAALTMDPDASTKPIAAAKPTSTTMAQTPVRAPGPARSLATGEERVQPIPTAVEPSERAGPILPARFSRKVNFINGAHVGLQSGIAPDAVVN